jgi:hypothetical protein
MTTGLHAARADFKQRGIDRSVRESSGRLKKRRGLIAAALGMGTNLAELLETRYAIDEICNSSRGVGKWLVRAQRETWFMILLLGHVTNDKEYNLYVCTLNILTCLQEAPVISTNLVLSTDKITSV